MRTTIKKRLIIIGIISAAALMLTVSVSAKPQLKDNYLNQPWGTIGTGFIFQVTYQDDSGEDPEYVKVIIDTTNEHLMEKISGNAINGIIYEYSFIATIEDTYFHTHYFEASDGNEIVKLFDPTTADQTYSGPMILESALDNNKIYFFSRQSSEPLWEYSIGKDWGVNVDVSSNANVIAAKTSDYVYVFSKEGELLWKFLTGAGNSENTDPSGFVTVLGDKIFTAGGGKVYHFNKNSSNPIWQYTTGYSVYNIQVSADGNYVAVGRYDDRLDLVNGSTGEILWHYDIDGGFHALGISSDGEYIIGGTHCPDRTGYLFSKQSNVPIWKKYLNEYGSPVWCGTISANGEYIIFGLDGSDYEQADIFFFHKDSDEPLWTYDLRNWVRSVAITDSGDLAVAGTGEGEVLLFSKESNTSIWKYDANAKVGAVDISSDGSYIAVGTKGKKVLLFSKDSNVPLWEFTASDWVNWVALSQDGEYLAALTGAPQYIFEGHSDTAPDGDGITGNNDSGYSNGTKGGTPGFEIIALLIAISIILFIKKKYC